MNADAGRHGRPGVQDQEEHELVDMSSNSYPGLAVDSRNTRRSHTLPQTWRHLLWRIFSCPNPILITLAIVMLIAVVSYNFMALRLPNLDNANSSQSGLAYPLATSSFRIISTTSPLTSSANRYSQPHIVQFRQHSTSSVNALPSDPSTSYDWVPGFYLIPMPVYHPRKSVILQSTSLPESSPATLQKPQLQELVPHLFATFSSMSTMAGPKPTSLMEKNPPFVFWGVTMLPPSNHKSFSDRMLIFCVKNVCSTNTTLASRCNNGVPEAMYERKECEWCWDNSSHVYHPNGTALHIHCQDVVKRSIKTLWIVGILCLFPLLVILFILFRRCYASQKRKRAAAKRLRKSTQGFEPGQTGGCGGDHVMLDPTRSNNDKDRDVARKSSKWFRPQKMQRKHGEKKPAMDMTATKDREMITRPDIPHSIDTEIFSNIRGMGQGKLLEGSNSQEDSLGLSRTSSRRERVLHTRNATVPAILVHRARGSSSNAEAQSGPECAN